jgi:hypothetical protein
LRRSPWAVCSSQVPDVGWNEAKVIVPKPALAVSWSVRREWRSAVQASCPEDAPDAVAVEIGQEVNDDEGGVIEGEVGGAAERAGHGAFLIIGRPQQLVRCGRPIKAIDRAAPAPRRMVSVLMLSRRARSTGSP